MADESLAQIEELINTRSIELGTDDLATPGALAEWLIARGLLPASTPVTPASHRKALRLREGLRALIAANNEPAVSADLADLDALARDLPLVLDISADPPRLVPRASGTVDAALATLLAAVAVAVADGSWNRLKACREPGCQWAYFDQSRNRSRAWCSMASCGNRAKARAFRRRTSGLEAGVEPA